MVILVPSTVCETDAISLARICAASGNARAADMVNATAISATAVAADFAIV